MGYFCLIISAMNLSSYIYEHNLINQTYLFNENCDTETFNWIKFHVAN